ncbi:MULTISPECIES: NACHT domain-containing protein [Rhizobium/Agrobacterium group]|uniref:NACHT domain-containing protein n=1 Tax=Rhizobium/Agrobacterium group TaxID=227290 RepID=UPI00107FAE56|nr:MULTISPECIES: hypothetical protein [Rhizobium/Agrobacterium group]MBB4402919.1 hypothetical protein [Agrobacterium radiobacter]MBB5589170.1 hypothetical protein [Agrobacterium radiobacter]TGE85705.1 hypothetical protein C9418_25330 [Rhizobium sp. SEMIA 4032]
MSPNTKPSGSALRDKVAGLLKCIHSEVDIEKSLSITTADVFFVDESNQIFPKKVAVECKDWKKGLASSDLAEIYNLYKPSLDSGEIDNLLIISEKELSQQPSRAASQLRDVRHISFERFVTTLMNFNYVLQDNIAAYENHDSSKNFIHTNVRGQDKSLEQAALDWLGSTENILLTYGGYGVGKTSFSLYFCKQMTERYRAGLFDRIPIRISLGDLFTKQDLKGVICSALTGADGGAAVRNFSYNLFIQMNREGYFLLILDGFDEMRHAMTLDDFRFIFEDMAVLFEGNSKTIILGRPDSFFSADEENAVIDAILSNVLGDLRWLRKVEVDLLRREQVAAYLEKFLDGKSEGPGSKQFEAFKDRVLEREFDILSRPVQLKMFTTIMGSLATSDSGFSRYDLYFQFIYRFVQRENTKSSRRFNSDQQGDVAVGYSDPRTVFMQQLAWWLLTEKKENRFKPHEVPADFVPQAIRNARGTDAALREIIVGSVVEQLGEQTVIGTKGPRIYYFPHKSYVEFLVAEFFCRETFSIEMYVSFFRSMNSEILSFIAEGPAEAVANMRTGLEYAKGTVSADVFVIAARDPAIEKEAPKLAEGNTTPGRLYVFYQYLLKNAKSVEDIENFLFIAISKATAMNRVAPAYAMLSDHLGRVKSPLLVERLIALVFNKVGVFKLNEMLSTGASIYSVDGLAAHMIFLSKCVTIERGVISIDMSDMKRFARDACQKSLYVSGFDAAPVKGAKSYSLKIESVRNLSTDIKPLLTGLSAKKRHTFKTQVHGKPDELLAGSPGSFHPFPK